MGDKDCKDHEIGLVQHAMGASCLVFVLPGCLTAYMIAAGSAIHCTNLAIGVSGFLGYVSVFAFLADYWYSRNQPAISENDIPEHQKQFVCNAIDRTNVPIIAIIEISLGIVQYLYAPTMNWIYPTITLIFGCAVGAQQVS